MCLLWLLGWWALLAGAAVAATASYLQARYRWRLGTRELVVAVVWTGLSYSMVLVLIAIVIAYVAITHYQF